MNANSDTRQLVAAAVGFIQQQSGCEAVGIRLRDGDDYPYYETHGFPKKSSCWKTRFVPATATATSAAITWGIPSSTACAAT